MTAYENSAAQKAAAIRAYPRRGVWRTVTAWLGLNPAARRADARAALWDHGARGEATTAKLLKPLQAQGWHILHDRALPGHGRANLDHVLVRGGIVVLDTKSWHAGQETCLIRGRVHCGTEDRHDQVEKVVRYAQSVARLVGVPPEMVVPLLVVHGSRIVSYPFPTGRLEARVSGYAGPVHVLGPNWLVPTLATAPSGGDRRGAGELAARVARALPPYRS
ncbi:nuclease-related domain-containing protein [Streptomyces sp. NPDC046862]|uniref:nuclease-related domain-containing protein n=1 Tax=Streptomyces sp. NPDC046862 TaxID=3154603 RepID=UPI0034538673